MAYTLDCVAAMKEVLGDKVGLALDCGPGWMLQDAIRFARAVEKHNLMWLEDMLTGDYVPYVNADVYRELTVSTSTPIHTGEQIYLRQNFKDLIERKAVRVVGPDPCDVGGIAELKWIAEYADLHGVMMAPHGTGNGVLGMAALVQVCAALPHNFIAFEYPGGDPAWWYDIVDGLPDPTRQGRHDRGLGSSRHGRRHQRRAGKALSGRRGQDVLRLRFTPAPRGWPKKRRHRGDGEPHSRGCNPGRAEIAQRFTRFGSNRRLAGKQASKQANKTEETA